MRRQSVTGQWSKVWQFGIGEALPTAKVLLPKPVIQVMQTVAPQRADRLTAADRGTDDQPVRCSDLAANRVEDSLVAAIGVNIGSATQPPTVQRGCVADQS